MRAFVTGAGGFLGKHLVRLLLQEGYEVTTYSRGNYPELQQSGVKTERGDIRDKERVTQASKGAEIVFHVAAKAGIWGPWKEYYGINTIGTENVLHACKKNGIPKLVYTSSPSVTFDGAKQTFIDETVPYSSRWLCNYPRSKALAEEKVLLANDSRNFLTCALRPHLIWGPGDQHLVPRLLDRARQGKLFQVGSGKNLIDITYVENGAFAHLQVARALTSDAKVCGNAYFLSQGEPVNCWHWISGLLALVDLPPVKKKISYPLARVVGASMEVAYTLLRKKDEPKMTRFLAAQLAFDHYFDISKAKDDFGYTPKISTEQGMKRLQEYLLSEGKG
ncbi:MAG: NAD-dependent epimerase/dehydratase family protein [Pirellulaceae bacterium]|nr:NAD-dependent epimerase/dehydratase family protein [Pirellulaceae bacterium]